MARDTAAGAFVFGRQEAGASKIHVDHTRMPDAFSLIVAMFVYQISNGIGLRIGQMVYVGFKCKKALDLIF